MDCVANGSEMIRCARNSLRYAVGDLLYGFFAWAHRLQACPVFRAKEGVLWPWFFITKDASLLFKHSLKIIPAASCSGTQEDAKIKEMKRRRRPKPSGPFSFWEPVEHAKVLQRMYLQGFDIHDIYGVCLPWVSFERLQRLLYAVKEKPPTVYKSSMDYNRAKLKELTEKAKYYSRLITTSAVNEGTLKKGPCEFAGPDCRGKIHTHHVDYTKPLKIRWLCSKHHGQEHGRLNRLKKAA